MKTLLLTLFLSTSIQANPMYAKESDPTILTHSEMGELIKDIEEVYPDIEINFENDLLKNATATHHGAKRNIIVHAGLGKAKYMSKDHFSLILCHEVGHHFGGAPMMEGEHNYWASDEGQADYFGAKECMRKVLRPHNEKILVKPIITKQCRDSYPQEEEEAQICIRTAKAAEEFGKRDFLLNHYDQEPSEIDYKEILLMNAIPVERSFRFPFEQYPSSQCRTDIMFQAALQSNYKPKCWFR